MRWRASATKEVLGRQRDVDAAIVKAVRDNTLLIEQAARSRHELVMTAYDDTRQERSQKLSDLRVSGLKSQEAQVRTQVEVEETLGSNVAQIVASSRDKHLAAMGTEKASMSSLWDQWSGRDAKMRKEELAVSIDWGEGECEVPQPARGDMGRAARPPRESMQGDAARAS